MSVSVSEGSGVPTLELSESVRSAETLASLKRRLKTYLFNISF